MDDLEREIRRRYLDQLDQPEWDTEDPRLDFGSRALPYFVKAFHTETCAERRLLLVRVIWQFRDQAVLETLAIALDDAVEEVWKEALDGIVTLGGDAAREILTAARGETVNQSAVKLEWIDEAVMQVMRRRSGPNMRE